MNDEHRATFKRGEKTHYLRLSNGTEVILACLFKIQRSNITLRDSSGNELFPNKQGIFENLTKDATYEVLGEPEEMISTDTRGQRLFVTEIAGDEEATPETRRARTTLEDGQDGRSNKQAQTAVRSEGRREMQARLEEGTFESLSSDATYEVLDATEEVTDMDLMDQRVIIAELAEDDEVTPETGQRTAMDDGQNGRGEATGRSDRHQQTEDRPNGGTNAQARPEGMARSGAGTEGRLGTGAGTERRGGSIAGAERTLGSGAGTERRARSGAGAERRGGSIAGAEGTLGSGAGTERRAQSGAGAERRGGSIAAAEGTLGSGAGTERRARSGVGAKRGGGSIAGPEGRSGSGAATEGRPRSVAGAEGRPGSVAGAEGSPGSVAGAEGRPGSGAATEGMPGSVAGAEGRPGSAARPKERVRQEFRREPQLQSEADTEAKSEGQTEADPGRRGGAATGSTSDTIADHQAGQQLVPGRQHDLFVAVKSDAVEKLQNTIDILRRGTPVEGLQGALGQQNFQELLRRVRSRLLVTSNGIETITSGAKAAMQVRKLMILMSRIGQLQLGEQSRSKTLNKMKALVDRLENTLRQAGQRAGRVRSKLSNAEGLVTELLKYLKNFLDAPTDASAQRAAKRIAESRATVMEVYGDCNEKLKEIADDFQEMTKILNNLTNCAHDETRTVGPALATARHNAKEAQAALEQRAAAVAALDQQLQLLNDQVALKQQQIQAIADDISRDELAISNQRSAIRQREIDETSSAAQARQRKEQRFAARREELQRRNVETTASLQERLETEERERSELDARLTQTLTEIEEARRPVEPRSPRNDRVERLREAARNCVTQMNSSLLQAAACRRALAAAHNGTTDIGGDITPGATALIRQCNSTMQILQEYANGDYRGFLMRWFGSGESFLEAEKRNGARTSLQNALRGYETEMETAERAAREAHRTQLDEFNAAQRARTQERERLQGLRDSAAAAMESTREEALGERNRLETALVELISEERYVISQDEERTQRERQWRSDNDRVAEEELRNRLLEDQAERGRCTTVLDEVQANVRRIQAERAEALEFHLEQQRRLNELNELKARPDELSRRINQTLTEMGAMRSDWSLLAALLENLATTADENLKNAFDKFVLTHTDMKASLEDQQEAATWKGQLQDVLNKTFELLVMLREVLTIAGNFERVCTKHALPIVSGATGYLGCAEERQEAELVRADEEIKEIVREVLHTLEEQTREEDPNSESSGPNRRLQD